ncbi:MAG: hypothetical protein H0U54_15760 [Acidobacteria bacterium]|nr:hypothetical protein [Acidobacteriota bacterium]
MKAKHYLRRFPIVPLFALCCLTLLWLPGTASAQYSSEQTISLSSFRPNATAEASRYRLRDGDVIMLTQEARSTIAPDMVEVVLNTASGVTWWKEIKLTIATRLGPDDYQVDKRITIQARSTQDRRHGPTLPLIFNIRRMESAYGGIVFSKAKFLGEHKEVYFLSAFDLLSGNMGGKRLTFTWQVD